MTEESPVNMNIVETTKTLVKNCIFCNLITANDPNIILEPRVKFNFIFISMKL